eukprot:TRINITY_DN4211_c0_g1_i1.p1 TRINITY_DN4211_c0_g1~~TRINITY_DN4211_c0_g1_i1.p1  ORF type:complete len:614 (+),score=94.78 TRINITY_DN4211_c0_g1_i1:172-2013(+)
MAELLTSFQDLRVFHGFLRPFTIYSKEAFRPSTCYLNDIIRYPYQRKEAKETIKERYILYSSPEYLQFLKDETIEKAEFDPFKSDFFSVALTALVMLTLQRVEDIYDIDTISIKEEAYKEFLQTAQQKIRPEMWGILSLMLELDPNKRPNMKGVWQLLNRTHRSQIASKEPRKREKKREETQKPIMNDALVEELKDAAASEKKSRFQIVIPADLQLFSNVGNFKDRELVQELFIEKADIFSQDLSIIFFVVVFPNLRELRIRECHLNSLKVEQIFSTLKQMTLEILDFYGNPDFEDEGLVILSACDQLRNVRSLNLEWCGIGLRGMKWYSSSQFLQNVSHLNLSWNTKLKKDGLTLLMLSENTIKLQQLYLDGCELDPSSMDVFSLSSKIEGLETLSLYKNPIGDAGIRSLTASKYLKSLRKLYVGMCQLTCESIFLLGDCSTFSLTTLHVHSSPLGDEAAVRLSEMPGFAQISDLNLLDTHITSIGVKAIASSERLSNLRRLFFSRNTNIGNEGFVSIAKSEQIKGLRELAMDECGLNDEAFETTRKDTALSQLERLELQRNSIHNTGIFAIGETEAFSNLNYLSLDVSKLKKHAVIWFNNNAFCSKVKLHM